MPVFPLNTRLHAASLRLLAPEIDEVAALIE